MSDSIGSRWQLRSPRRLKGGKVSRIKKVIEIEKIVGDKVRYAIVEGALRVKSGTISLSKLKKCYQPYNPGREEWAIYLKGGRPEARKIPNWLKAKLDPVIGGFGYYGILMCDSLDGKVQCHICGYWFDHLGAHVRVHDRMSADDYREEFELGSIGLASLEYWQACHDHAIEMDLVSKIKSPKPWTESPDEPVSLRGKIATMWGAKDEERREKISQAAFERYANMSSEDWETRLKLLERIRPDLRGVKKGSFSEEHKQAIAEYQRNRTSQHRENLLAAIKCERHERSCQYRQRRYSEILAYLVKHGESACKAIAKYLDVGVWVIQPRLRELVVQGKVIRLGGGNKIMYEIGEHHD